MSVQGDLFEREGSAKRTKSAAKVEEIVGRGFDVDAFVEDFHVLADAMGGILRLRQLVLGMAVSGRLSGGSRDGWRDAPVGEIADCVLGKMLDKSKHTKGTSRPYLRNINVRWGAVDLSDVLEMFFKDDELDRYGVRPGDVLICEGGEPGRATVWTDARPMLIQKAIHRVRPSSNLLPDWLVLNLRYDTWSGRLEHLFTGATIKHFTGKALASYVIPLPPLAEQKRIVAKVDQLMALCDELEARQSKKRETGARLTKSTLEALITAEGPEEFDVAWKRVVDNFDVLIGRAEAVEEVRRALVDLASRGRLTARGIEGAPVPQVLEMRSHERRRAWEQRELERMRRGGKEPRDSKWKAAYEEPVFSPAESLPSPPAGWAYAPIGLLGHDPFCPVQTGPFGAQLHASEFVSTGVPVIAVGNLTGSGFTEKGLYFVTEEKAAQLARYDVQAGDLLFARSGATLGKVCVAPNSVKGWRMTGHILRVRLDPRVIRSDIASLWLWASTAVKEQVTATIRGGTRPGYNTNLLESIVLPIPPLEEQARIIAKLEQLMKVCDELEACLRRAEDRAAKLVEAVVQELVA